MKIIFKYLKPYAVFVVLSVAMLFGQVVCELTLPNLMSSLVNEIIKMSAHGGGANDYIKTMGFKMIGSSRPISLRELRSACSPALTHRRFWTRPEPRPLSDAAICRPHRWTSPDRHTRLSRSRYMAGNDGLR